MRERRIVTSVIGFGAGPLLVLGALLLLGACGGGGSDGQKGASTAAPATKAAASSAASPGATAPPRASAGAIDACALVTKAEVEAALGDAVLDPKPEQVPNFASCDFNDPSFPEFRMASVSVLTGASGSDVRDIFDVGKRNANDPQPVAGLGEEAYWDGVGTLDVVTGTYEITIDVAPIESADRLAAAQAIAAKVLGRLP